MNWRGRRDRDDGVGGGWDSTPRDTLDVAKRAEANIPNGRRPGLVTRAKRPPTAYEVALEIKRLRARGTQAFLYEPTNEEVGQAAIVLSVFEQLKERSSNAAP